MATKVDVFQALGEAKRFKMVELLADQGTMAASEIADKFQISAPAVSQHLRVLREAGLVKVEKRSQRWIYRINADAMSEIEDWARRTREVWEARFERLDALLNKEGGRQ